MSVVDGAGTGQYATLFDFSAGDRSELIREIMRIRSSLTGLVAASFAVFSFSALGCSSDPSDSSVDSTESDVTAAKAAPTYFRLEKTAGETFFSAIPLNRKTVECSGVGTTRRCPIKRFALPADCGFECTDGLFGLQGVSIVRGVVSSEYDASHKKIAILTAAAAFTSFDSSLEDNDDHRDATPVFYRVTQTGTVIESTVLNETTSQKLTRVDFSTCHDPNYVLEPSRGVDQMTRPEGLIVTGTIANRVFKVDRVWRQSTPVADCDVLGAARAHFFHTPEVDEVNLELPTTLAAESYRDAQGRQINWLVKNATDANTVGFTGGINDLWAQTFDVSTRTCAVTVTGEH